MTDAPINEALVCDTLRALESGRVSKRHSRVAEKSAKLRYGSYLLWSLVCVLPWQTLWYDRVKPEGQLSSKSEMNSRHVHVFAHVAGDQL